MPTATKTNPLAHLKGMTRQEFARRHMLCTPDLQMLRTVEGLEKKGHKVKVVRDKNGYPTGTWIMPGGAERPIKGTCNHPEDLFCGFDPIAPEVLELLANGKVAQIEQKTPTTVLEEIEEPTPEQIAATETPTDDDEDNDFPEFDEPISDAVADAIEEGETSDYDWSNVELDMACCPNCETIGQVKMHGHGEQKHYLLCLNCDHVGTIQSFYEECDEEPAGAELDSEDYKEPEATVTPEPETSPAEAPAAMSAADMRALFQRVLSQ